MTFGRLVFVFVGNGGGQGCSVIDGEVVGASGMTAGGGLVGDRVGRGVLPVDLDARSVDRPGVGATGVGVPAQLEQIPGSTTGCWPAPEVPWLARSVETNIVIAVAVMPTAARMPATEMGLLGCRCSGPVHRRLPFFHRARSSPSKVSHPR